MQWEQLCNVKIKYGNGCKLTNWLVKQSDGTSNDQNQMVHKMIRR